MADDEKKKDEYKVRDGSVSPPDDSTQDYTLFQKHMAGVAMLSALVVVFITVVLAYRGNLRILPPRDPVHISTFSSKLEFTARYWILGLVWLYISMHLVVMKRITTRAANPLSGNENLVAASVKVFTNSIEQFVISVVGQVTLITFLESEKIITLIPLINVMYLIGRIFFWIGYPKFRSFGMTVTMFPISLSIYFALYRFVIHWLDPQILMWRSV
jgi:hypothetical protein